MDPFAPPKKYYLLRIQFLGFRYHGWQKQPGVKTLQKMMEKTICFVLGENIKFKILGASRTDAMVSADDFPLELFLESELPYGFLDEINYNLPNDIKALSIIEVNAEFNVIKDVISKEYHYNFAFGTQHNPFSAPFCTYLYDELDLDKMQQAATLFIGTPNLASFSYPFELGQNKSREIDLSCIEKHDEGSYVYKVRSSGFMRYQVRFMMGTLFEIGKGSLTIENLKMALEPNSQMNIAVKAAASGLRLHFVEYNNL